MGRKSKGYGYRALVAMDVAWRGDKTFVSLDENVGDDEEDLNQHLEFEVSASIKSLTPEQQVILQEAYENLSIESREVMCIIIFWPDTLEEEIGRDELDRRGAGRPPYKGMFKRVMSFLKGQGYETEKIKRELKTFVDVYFSIEEI